VLNVPAAEVTTVDTYVGDVPFLGLHITNNGAGFLIVSVTFRASQGGADVGGYFVRIAAGGLFTWSLPVRGPFVHIGLQAPPAGTNPVAIHVYEAASPGVLDPRGNNEVDLIRVQNQAIGAGLSMSFDALATWPGWATWQVSAADDVPYSATLDQRITAGTFQRLQRAHVECGFDMYRLVTLPLNPMRITVFNDAAASVDFDVSLIAHAGIVE
jgi:hypothetical protein